MVDLLCQQEARKSSVARSMKESPTRLKARVFYSSACPNQKISWTNLSFLAAVQNPSWDATKSERTANFSANSWVGFARPGPVPPQLFLLVNGWTSQQDFSRFAYDVSGGFKVSVLGNFMGIFDAECLSFCLSVILS